MARARVGRAGALVFLHIYHDDCGLAVLGDRLRRTARGLDNFAEAVLRILHRPAALGHARLFLARISS
jgi:hypothetical protein